MLCGFIYLNQIDCAKFAESERFMRITTAYCTVALPLHFNEVFAVITN